MQLLAGNQSKLVQSSLFSFVQFFWRFVSSKGKARISLFCIGISLGILGGEHTLRAVEDGARFLSYSSWAQERSDIPADLRVTYGTLSNGFRYVLMPNHEPPQRISIKFWVDMGSLFEEEDQQGLAHFLEHAAFLGTNDFDAREQKEYFQRLGMKFGADTNAHTGFAETAYKLELPDNNKELLQDAFRLLKGYAHEILIPEEEIIRERGVILSEKRDRDGARYRTLIERYQFLFDGTRLISRFPIGIEEVISQATSEQLRKLYEKWYIPQRMVLIVVGDMNVAEIEKLIQETFEDLQNPRVAPETPTIGVLNPHAAPFGFHRESEYEVAQVGLYQVYDYVMRMDNLESRYADLAIQLSNDMLTQRFSREARKEEARFSGGYGLYDEGYQTYKLYGVDVSGQPRYWKEGIEVAVEQLRRAVEYGFLPVEFEEAKARYIRGLEATVEAMPTAHSSALSNALMRSVADDFVFSHPEFDLAIGHSFLESLTLEQVNQAFAKAWGKSTPRVYLTGNLPEEVTLERIQEVFNQAWAEEVTPPEAMERPEFAYKEFGEAGSIESKQSIEDLDIQQWILSNGIRVNLKQTDFENDRIHLLLRIDGGLLSLPESKPGLAMLANMALMDGGLGKHSTEEIQRIFAGKLVGLHFSVENDAFSFSAMTTPKELGEQLALLAAFLTDPGFRNEGLRAVQESLPLIYSRFSQTPEGNWNFLKDRLLFKPDYRLEVPEKEEVESLNMEDLKEWLLPALQSAYAELSIVGDFNRESLEKELLSTLGALPIRAGSPKPEGVQVEFQEKRGLIRNEFQSEFPRALSIVVWPGVDYWQVPEKRKLRILSEIFTDRLDKRLRGEVGDVYSPYSFVRDDEAFKNYGFFAGISLVATKEIDKVTHLIQEEATKLAEGEINEDALQRAREPVLKQIRDSARNNQYWLGSVLSRSQSRPETLNYARNLYDMYAGFTLEEIKEVAAEYLKPEKAFMLEFVPNNQQQ